MPLATLFLDPTTNDLCADSSGNIAKASPPYSVAQDVATAIKTFALSKRARGDCWYDQELGINWFDRFLGKQVPLSLIKSECVRMAMLQPDVVTAVVYIDSIDHRTIKGQVQITDTDGNVTASNF